MRLSCNHELDRFRGLTGLKVLKLLVKRQGRIFQRELLTFFCFVWHYYYISSFPVALPTSRGWLRVQVAQEILRKSALVFRLFEKVY